MPQRAYRFLAATFRVFAPAGALLLALPVTNAHAEAQGGLGMWLDIIYLLAMQPLLPLLPFLAGAGLFLLTRSYLISTGLTALVFGAWAAYFFSRSSLAGPLPGALYGLQTDGAGSALAALAGSGYVHLIGAEARRLGTKRTAIAHGAGIAFAVAAFVLLLVTGGSDTAGTGLYIAMLALTLGLSAATGSFGGVAATMALALLAMVHGIWGAAVASGVPDAGQAYIAILYVPALLVPVVAAAALGRWLGARLRAP